MRRLRVLIVAGLLSAGACTSALAQFEQSDAKYREQRREERAEGRRLKLMIGVGVVVVAGAIWVVKKLRGKA